jgi:LemA protein
MAEEVLGTAMGKLMALVEAYPELKADQSLRELAEELTSTENKVAFSRQLFNDATLDYNNAAQQFPTSMMANLFGFRSAAMLQSTASEAERTAVRVQL